MLRRSFLQLLGGLAALVTTFKFGPAKAEPPIFVEGDLRPSWCPKGFLPLQGQCIGRNQYPALFDKVVIQGRNFVPKYHGREIAYLEKPLPNIPTELQKAGWQDTLTRTGPTCRNWINVALISTEHLEGNNGRPLRAGFVTYIQVDKDVFEKTYGEIQESSPITLSYGSYSTIDDLVKV